MRRQVWVHSHIDTSEYVECRRGHILLDKSVHLVNHPFGIRAVLHSRGHSFDQSFMDQQDIHTLRLMGEIEQDGGSSQRELSKRLNLSLGLVNTFLKRLVNKGYFKVKTMPNNRMKYFLTPKGVARKTRLTIEYLQYSARFYRDIKQVLMNKFSEMKRDKIESILFFGAGEVAEISFLYLQQTGIRLVGVVDDEQEGRHFFHFTVEGVDRLCVEDWDAILLTHLENTVHDIRRLTESGVQPARIVTLWASGMTG